MRNYSGKRTTGETDIEINLEIDGTGKGEIDTGIGFFDHMLNSFTKHGLFDMTLSAEGDTYVDSHHTVEDTGIVIGKALKEALGDKKSIKRFASCYIPFDETLVFAAVDISGRPYLVFDAELPYGKAGDMDVETAEDFFRGLAFQAGINLHIKLQYGRNVHHIIEGMFKAVARCIREAAEIDPRVTGVPSTKGTLTEV